MRLINRHQELASEKSIMLFFRGFISTALLCYLFFNKAWAQDYFVFNQYDIVAPFNISQAPLSANLLPNYGNELILIGEKNGDHKLALFAWTEDSQSYQMLRQVDLPKTFFSFDLGEVDADGLQSLYFLTSNQVMQFKPTADEFYQPILDVQSIYINSHAHYLRQADFVVDINKDGLADVVLADFAHLNVYIQQSNTQFIAQKIPISPTVEIFDGSVSYTEKPYYFVDMTMDNLQDIVLSGDGELQVYVQQKQGKFDLNGKSISINPSITGVNWWDTRGADGQNLDQSNLKHRTIEHLIDINNDNLPDMVVQYTQSSGVLDKSNDYEIYLASVVKGELVYPAQASSLVKAQGTLTDLDFIDIDNDAQKEIMTSSFDISVSQIISALLTGSVDQDVLIYALNSDNEYQTKISKEVELTFNLTSGKSGSPVIKMTDLNGDGVKDLVLSSSEQKLSVYPGKAKGNLLHKKAQKLAVKLPKNGALLSSEDLDQDGRSELLVRYSLEDGEDMQSRLLVVKVE
ncbi:FG-GAP repeat domain-containing protein [Thalassotalea aquiviva]|uniref:FG-GAP repeat domain-containing protein n=1 Tax=Thalassotalea aquiviva TaxID=3242415 RepID=UPI00352AF409